MLRTLVFPLMLAVLAACHPRFEWRELRSADGYVAVLPGRAQTVTRELTLPDGQRVQMTIASSGVGATMFAVGSAQLPAAIANDAAAREASVNYFREALLRNVQGKLIARSPAPPVTGPGVSRRLHVAQSIEASAAGPDGRPARLAARFYVVDDRLFQLVALGAEGEIPAEALETFFTSFRLT